MDLDLMPSSTMEFELVGTSPLVMHNGRLADPDNEWARRLADAVKATKRKNADKDVLREEMRKVEFAGGLYFNARLGPCVPAEAVRTAIASQAGMERGKSKVQRGLAFVPGERQWPLHFVGREAIEKANKGQWSPDDLWRGGLDAEEGGFVDVRNVRVQRNRLPRTRPMFSEGWSVSGRFRFLTFELMPEELIRWLLIAGQLQGIGDNRANGYGRFDVVRVWIDGAKVYQQAQAA